MIDHHFLRPFIEGFRGSVILSRELALAPLRVLVAFIKAPTLADFEARCRLK